MKWTLLRFLNTAKTWVLELTPVSLKIPTRGSKITPLGVKTAPVLCTVWHKYPAYFC